MSYRAFSPCLLIAAITLAISHVSANPIGPGNIAVVSEVQVLEPDFWFIELDPQMFADHFRIESVSVSIGTQSQNQSYQGYGTQGMKVHASIPFNGIKINPQNIGVISSSECPGILINPSHDIVFVGIDTFYNTWQIAIDTLKPNQSIVGINTSSCCLAGPTGCSMYCRNPAYFRRFCPSIGIENNAAGGALFGWVFFKDSATILSSYLLCWTLSGGQKACFSADQGFFRISSDTCTQIRFSLMLPDSTKMTLQNSGPFGVHRGMTDTVRLYLANDVTKEAPDARIMPPPTAMSCRILGVFAEADECRLVFALSHAGYGRGMVLLSTLEGANVARLSFSSEGPGTYSVAWKRRGSARGPLVCVINIGAQSARTRIIAP